MANPDRPRPGEIEQLPLITHPQFTLDPNTRAFHRLDREFDSRFSKNELTFFSPFANNPNLVIPGEQAIAHLNRDFYNPRQYAAVMVRNVRVRLSDDPAEAAELFRNVNGLGYMLVDHSRPIELIPDRDKQISFQVTIDSNRADVLERTLQDAGVAVRRLEPGVQLYLDNLQLPTKHINYPPIEEPDTLQNIHNRHFTFDPNTGEVTIGDRVVSLTTLEARTLYLIANSTVPVHISKICQYVGNGELVYDDQYARMMISKLRKKLGLSGSSDPIETISGKGLYRIRE